MLHAIHISTCVILLVALASTDAQKGTSISITGPVRIVIGCPVNGNTAQIGHTETCRENFFRVGSECFLVGQEDHSWHDARSYCQDMGADLAQPSNFTALRTYLEEEGLSGDGYPGDYWIGGQDIDNDGTWKWLSGTRITDGWSWRQPDNSGGEEYCLDFRRDGLNDYTCTHSQKFLCEQ